MRIGKTRETFKTFATYKFGTTQSITTQALFDEFKANYTQSSKNFKGHRRFLSARTGATTFAVTLGTAAALQYAL